MHVEKIRISIISGLMCLAILLGPFSISMSMAKAQEEEGEEIVVPTSAKEQF
jgi:hypothetical protein